MAITVKVEEKQDKEISFPCLMKDVNSELVVLFIGDRTGFIIVDNGGLPIGWFGSDWESASDTTEWEPSTPITLSNS